MECHSVTRLPGFLDLLCGASDCDREVYGRGLCNKHWQMIRKNPTKAASLGVQYGQVRRQNEVVDRPSAALAAALAALDTDECIHWTGSCSPGGYGIVGSGEHRNRNAHRVVYELLVGLVPDGMQLDHLCHSRDNSCPGGSTCPHRACVNVAHLEPVTASQNSQRSVKSRVDRCAQGHDYTPENTGRTKPNKFHPHGARYCKACSRVRNARRRAT